MDSTEDVNSRSDRSEPPGLTIRSANLALQQARLVGDSPAIFATLVQLAQLHFRQGRYSQTQILLAEVRQNAPDDSLARCDALRILGNCAAEMGEPERAEAIYYQAIDLARQLNDRFTLYKCLHSLATNIYWQHGQFDLMLSAGQEALSQAQALGLAEDLWFPLSDIAWAYWVSGQVALATRIADQMEQCTQPGSLGYGFYCCLRAGLTQPASGFLDNVLPLYQLARSIAETTGDPGLCTEVRLGLCRSYRLAGNLSAASTWANETVDAILRMKYNQFLGVAYIERARTSMETGNLTSALADLHAAVDVSTELQANFDLARCHLYQAAVYFAQHDPQAAASWAQAAGLIQNHGYGFLLQQERSLVLPLIAAHLDSPNANLAQTSKMLYQQFMQSTPAPLQVKMLGQFSVWVGANCISKETLRQRRAGELLALLLTRAHHTLTYQQVAEEMCPDKSPQAALDFYHHAISALRHLLEPELTDRRFPCRYLDVDEEQIRLKLPPGSKVDYQEFEACCRAQRWEQAVAAYPGEFLPALREADWTNALRQYLADQHEMALIKLAEIRLQAGNASTCLELCQQALLHNPWQEQAVELGMQAALALGDRMTAVKLYQRLEKVLAKELGIAPQKELQLLYAAARRRSIQ